MGTQTNRVMVEAGKLKPGWTLVKFGDVVKLSKARCSNPQTEGIERYVGLEHIDPDDLRIRRWGLVEDGITFTSRFKPGQVLFGKRRAYLRKVAVADFEGICSGDIYVFESADPKILLPELLPFICQTERFLEYAIGTSAGSLSPRTNWKSLVNFEFALPPLEEQRRLVVMLHSLEVIRNGLDLLISKSQQLSDSLFNDFLLLGWTKVSLKQVIDSTQYGLSLNADDSGEYPILRMMNLEDGRCVENDIKYVDLSDREFENYQLFHGDVLFNRTNSYELVGRTGMYTLLGNHVFASYIVRLKTKETELDPRFLTLFLNSAQGRRQVLSFATRGVSQSNVNVTNLLRVKMPLPPIHEQQKILEQIEKIETSKKSSRIRNDTISSLKQVILS